MSVSSRRSSGRPNGLKVIQTDLHACNVVIDKNAFYVVRQIPSRFGREFGEAHGVGEPQGERLHQRLGKNDASAISRIEADEPEVKGFVKVGRQKQTV